MFASPIQIQAIFALQAKENNDPKFHQLVTALAKRRNMTEDEVIKGIEALAQGAIF